MREYQRKYMAEIRADPKRHQNYLQKVRDNDLKNAYGLTRQEYEALRDYQGGGCAICGAQQGRPKKRRHNPRDLAVDHDHRTGRIRGLLCDDCNIGIGVFLEDPVRLRRAATYIEMHHGDVK